MFYADLHIHSKYSRATSRDLDLEHISLWAQKKGIAIVATGDFTHPAWFKEIQDKLVPSEPGLFMLRRDIQQSIAEKLPPSCRLPTRFMLSVEISTIYKKGERTRKVHHLIYAPDVETVRRMNTKLARIGNLKSDGRPILGLDSRHLLEIALDAGEGAYLVPAHIWTPWFSALGSKSGFDSIQECYGDLAQHIFAVETGLSSDPEMNWRVSHLDRYRLVSNSDAHSPQKLGREACCFETELDYFAIKQALETGKRFGGTVEFFPEEGKYHADGHRKCGVRLTPEESQRHGDRCPVCKEQLTLGVLHRVQELADRPSGVAPAHATPFKSLIPLPEVLSELLQVGPMSKAISKEYEAITTRLGTELAILNEMPLDDVKHRASALLAEAIQRMRERRVIREAGYDGEYGVIRLFEEGELGAGKKSGLLFAHDAVSKPDERVGSDEASGWGNRPKAGGGVSPPEVRAAEERSSLDPEQCEAATCLKGPLLIIAGPGSGKTRTLTHRIAFLIQHGHATPEECLAITFTRRAAHEMKERLHELLPDIAETIPVMTFHGFAHRLLQRYHAFADLPEEVRVAAEEERHALLETQGGISAAKSRKVLREISLLKRLRKVPSPNDEIGRLYELYTLGLKARSLIDYDDLLCLALSLLETHPEIQAELQQRYRWISIDEYQDIDELQFQLIRLLVPADGNLCAIGDPDQAIYSFRGGDVRFFVEFQNYFPSARIVRLTKNYRSPRSILDASFQVIRSVSLVGERTMEALLEDDDRKIILHDSPTDRAEALYIAQTIEELMGGSSFLSIDMGRGRSERAFPFSFADFAILYRTADQADLIASELSRFGMPYRRASHTGDEVEWDPRADLIALMTLHASKGLEFPVVFIVGCEDGIVPLRWGGGIDESQLAEERRLFFVGMTRAKAVLVLSHARSRLWRGKIQAQSPSPFLQAIEEQLLERVKQASTPKKRPAHEQIELF